MSVANSIMIKYGLGHLPSGMEIARWVTETEKLIAQGHSAEDAGRRAAKTIFYDFDTHFYKAQSDTILALLDAAKRRK
jgi:hypothetical protein